MKLFHQISLISLAIVFFGCQTTLFTVATATHTPTPPTRQVVYSSPVSTTTTVKSNAGTTTTTVQVNAMSSDISLYLDLQAVAAAFAQSSSVEEFEMILNSSRYMISNLDLNRDGYVDYLRVMEVVNSYNHVFVIQAVLAYNVFQNVATITLEMGPSTTYCQIIGDAFVYGPNYIVQPVFVKTPPLFTVITRAYYTPWTSPYYWGYLPSYYSRPAPQYLSHYQAYVNTFITNHKYCHQVTYPTVIHYTNYITIIQNVSRNDYRTAHPEESFERRTANMTYTPSGSTTSRSVRNASDVRQAVSTASTTTTGTSRTAQQKASTTTTTSASRSATTSSATSSSNTAARSAVTATTQRETTTTTTRTSASASTSPSRATTTTKTTTTTSRTAATSPSAPQPGRTTSTTSKVNTGGQVRSTSTVKTTVDTPTRSTTTSSSRSATSSGTISGSTTSRTATSTSRTR